MGGKAKLGRDSEQKVTLQHLETAELEQLSENSAEGQEPEISVFRPDRQGVRKVLGDLEADLMEYIWENVPTSSPGITVREVYEAFRTERVIAYTTVMSTMARLARKHLLRVHKVDNAYIYSPNLTKADYIDNFVSRILENLLVSFSHTTSVHMERLATGDSAERVKNLKAKVAELRATRSPSKHKEAGSPEISGHNKK